MSAHNPNKRRPILRGKTIWRVKEDRGDQLTLSTNGGLILEMSAQSYERKILNRFK